LRAAPFIYKTNDYHQLVEMIESNRLFGAQRFIFYNFSTGADIQPYLRSYQSYGTARVFSWPLPLYTRNEAMDSDAFYDVHYFGQMAAINDCLYRNMFTSRFIVFTDLDELIVPRRRGSWLELMRDVSPPPKGGSGIAKEYAPFFLVRNVLFRRDWDDDAAGMAKNALARRLQLRTLLTTNRESIVFPMGVKTKYIVDPRRITIAGIHCPYRVFKDAAIGVNIDEPDALLHHYRIIQEVTVWNNRSTPVRDTFMHTYADVLMKRALERTRNVTRSFRHRKANDLSGVQDDWFSGE